MKPFRSVTRTMVRLYLLGLAAVVAALSVREFRGGGDSFWFLAGIAIGLAVQIALMIRAWHRRAQLRPLADSAGIWLVPAIIAGVLALLVLLDALGPSWHLLVYGAGLGVCLVTFVRPDLAFVLRQSSVDEESADHEG